MNHSIRHLVQVAATTMFLMFAGASAAFAGPAPLIEPEFTPPAADPRVTETGGGFPWLLTSGAVLIAIALVVLAALLWHRVHVSHRRLVTP